MVVLRIILGIFLCLLGFMIVSISIDQLGDIGNFIRLVIGNCLVFWGANQFLIINANRKPGERK
ncbi:hypothetical protein FCL54_11135 [Pseudalkalibacillus caeni]|uniref:Uncharacterized protein n=1 Tax=Exobacillus caeni TaxID=2574798 RepID=A0A5R9F0L0_9BACL|nr:hypothetical protein FCL54_11135 [Pseudalkalibacillus caeni]